MVKWIRLFAVVAAVLTGIECARADLVVNGGFETGDFSGWTVTLASSGSDLKIAYNDGPNYIHSGRYSALFGALGSEDDSIMQTLMPTVAGQSYVFDFWLKRFPPSDHYPDKPNDFTALWNGTPVLALSNATPFDWQEYTFTRAATGPTTPIGFSGRDNNLWYALDDISVDPVPEPSERSALFGLAACCGVGMIGLVRRCWVRA